MVEFKSGAAETETWLVAGLGLGATRLSGMLAGLGLLATLICDTLTLDAALEPVLVEILGAGFGAGAGGGVLGAALGGGLGGGVLGALGRVCWLKAMEENSRTAATERLESRIKHL